jgi:DeoR family transcriptional regulator of aga operon/DeoR family fructose operon transcriptional repressor
MDQHGRASVADLALRFGVSQVTIRKDLESLEADQRLIRTHGGAIASERSQAELAFDIRERRQREEKQAIGAAAAAMVASGDSIALDASTTALHLAWNLRQHTELSVVTNGLHIAAELAALPGITVLMPGGRLRWEAFSLVGSWGDVLLSGVNIQRAFLGATGFTLETGLTDVTEDEAAIKRQMVAAAREVIAVIDHTKWDRVGVATFCALERISLVITDTAAPAELVAGVRARGIEVLQVEPAAPPSDGREAVGSGVMAQPFRRGTLGPRLRGG